MKNNTLLSGIAIGLAALFVTYGLYAQHQKKTLMKKVSELAGTKEKLIQEAGKIKKELSAKEEALKLAQQQNFQADLVTAQAALKEINEKLGQVIREKASFENTNLILDNRLKNTTNELTRTLDDLKRAREALGGIEGPYRTKISQLSENAKLKDEQLTRFQASSKEKESVSADFQKHEKDVTDSLGKYRVKISELEKSIVGLNKSLFDKEKMLSDKQAELESQKRESAAQRGRSVASGQKEQGRPFASADLDRERAQLEQQISDSSAKLFDQQKNLKDLEKKVADMNETLGERELVLIRKEKELRERSREIDELQAQVKSLKRASSYSARTEPILSQTQKRLQEKVGQLERERDDLEDRLREAQKAPAASVESKDPFADRNFRIMTETLVRKEDQIQQLETELNALKRERLASQGGSGLKEKRMAELEILVTALTKQLGEYAGMIEDREVQLKSSAAKVAVLSQEVEAQKVSSIALQRELVEARARQEKTFQSLTQIMGMNAGASSSSEDWSAAGDEVASIQDPAVPDKPYDVKKRAAELKKQVEVLLEQKN